MLTTTTRRAAVEAPLRLHPAVVPAVTVSAFVWLLAGDAIAPLAIYALQLFLSF